jgi:hypothetical protein
MRKAAHMLEEEVLLTPWNLTSNFVSAVQVEYFLCSTYIPIGRQRNASIDRTWRSIWITW